MRRTQGSHYGHALGEVGARTRVTHFGHPLRACTWGRTLGVHTQGAHSVHMLGAHAHTHTHSSSADRTSFGPYRSVRHEQAEPRKRRLLRRPTGGDIVIGCACDGVEMQAGQASVGVDQIWMGSSGGIALGVENVGLGCDQVRIGFGRFGSGSAARGRNRPRVRLWVGCFLPLSGCASLDLGRFQPTAGCHRLKLGWKRPTQIRRDFGLICLNSGLASTRPWVVLTTVGARAKLGGSELPCETKRRRRSLSGALCETTSVSGDIQSGARRSATLA